MNLHYHFSLESFFHLAGAFFCLMMPVLAWVNCRRRRWQQKVIAVEAVRLLVTACLFWTMLAPEEVQQQQAEGKNGLLLLSDQTTSMDTEDIGEKESRKQWLTAFQQQPLPPEAEQRFSRTNRSFGSAESGTDIAAALAAVNSPTPLEIILCTDGDWNRGRSPIEEAVRLRQQGHRLHTLTIG